MDTAELSRIPAEKLNYLNENHIFLQLHKSKRKYVLTCDACGTTLPTVGAAIQHTSMNYHHVNVTTTELKHTLLYLPPITDSHRIALNSSLKSSVVNVIADGNEIQRRKNFAHDLIMSIEARIPNIKVRGTGSLWFDLALPDSHVSLDVICIDDVNRFDSQTIEPVADFEIADQSSPQSASNQWTDENEGLKVNSVGIGYALSRIFELLQSNSCEPSSIAQQQTIISEENTVGVNSSVDDTTAKQLSDKPKFPKFHTVLRTSTDYFYLSLTDVHGINYRISTGHPYGHDLAKLIDTYLKLNKQARQLAILFRKLSRLGHLDMPENGTFEEPVIPLLVIFYFQRCYPPLLPNLHTIYREHVNEIPQGSYHQVLLPDDDCSFVTDIEVIRKLCPHEPFTDPSSSCQSTSLADLWLGLLRFYLFDFKLSACVINIVESKPVGKSCSGKGYFTVIDPFNSKRNLCYNVTAASLDYINSQLLAAYGYFGVPRLSHNGRHLFTRIAVAREISVSQSKEVESVDVNAESKQNIIKSSSKTTTNENTKVAIVHLTPIIDDCDDFVSNLDKITNLLTEKFHSLSNAENDKDAFQSFGSEEMEVPLDHTQSFNDKLLKPRMLSLSQMLPYILHSVLDELLESDDVPGVVNNCLDLPEHKFFAPLSATHNLTLNDFNRITRNFAYCFWSSYFKSSISKGKFTVQKRQIVKSISFVFRKAIKHWLPTCTSTEFLVKQNEKDDDDSLREPPSTTLQKAEGSTEEKSNKSSTNSSSKLVSDTKDNHISDFKEIDLSNKEKTVNSIDIVNDDKTVEEEDLSLNMDNFDSPNRFLLTDGDAEEQEGEMSQLFEINDSYDAFIPHEEVFLLDDVDNQNNFIDDSMTEDLECSLELGDDDLNDSSVDPTVNSSFIEKNSNTMECFLSSEPGSHHKKRQSDSVNQTSDSISVIGSTPNKSVIASETIVGCNVAGVPPPSKLSRRAQKASKQNSANNNKTVTIKGNTGVTKSNSPKAKRGKRNKVLQWNDVILSRHTISPPVDDDRPDYYNSKLLKDLKPEDLDFTFSARSVVSPRGRHTQSSVLGLAARNQPSTLLAHFDAPQPQCQACGVTGHRWTQCQSTNEKSVSFLAWRKLLNKTPWPPTSRQLKELSDCLELLEKHHEADERNYARKELVQNIQKVFSARFPSVKIELFGSCANGFDLHSSDLDVCVFFPPGSPEWNALKKESTAINLIKQFRRQLFWSSNLLNVTQIQPVLRARVPILKVSFKNSFEADISFSNYLALSNTRMLAFYAELQPKLRTLGVALKTVTKITKIGKASAGGISSYACIIMLIHYLQQINQLPVLQELYEESTKPVILVNGWNVWYQNDLSVINRLWKPNNPEPLVGDLWLGFFRYYLFEFDHDSYVVTIRQKILLIRFMKMWRSLLAIEDPFNLNHNLTAGFNYSKLLYMLNVFHTVLVHHTTFLSKQMSMGQWCYCLFAPDYIVVKTDSLKNTHCFVCQRTGHISSQCPKNQKAVCTENKNEASTVYSLIGHFLSTPPAQIFQSSQRPMLNKSVEHRYNNHQKHRQAYPSKSSSSSTETSASFFAPSNYVNPFRPQNNHQMPPVHNSYSLQPFPHHNRPPNYANVHTSPNIMLTSHIPQPPSNVGCVRVIKPGLLDSNGMYCPQNLNNTYQQQLPYQNSFCRYSSYGSIKGQQYQNSNCISQGNLLTSCTSYDHQIGHQNKNSKWIANPLVSPTNTVTAASNVTASQHSPYSPKKLKNNHTTAASTHQTTNVSQISGNYESVSKISKSVSHRMTNAVLENAPSPPSNKGKCNSGPTKSYNQQKKQSTSPLDTKSNFQLSSECINRTQTKPSKLTGSTYPSQVTHIENEHQSDSKKPNRACKNRRNPKRFTCSNVNGSPKSNNLDVDKNLVERLHNMSTAFSP
ncbi:unnamed protein product [Heterobilharzia americana]|nr:unnamed protein product [Heterobilharzia americana]